MSLANSGHFADSEGDQGDGEAEEDESLGGDERFDTVIPIMSLTMSLSFSCSGLLQLLPSPRSSERLQWEVECSTRGSGRRRGRGLEEARKSQRARPIVESELWTSGT